jgi:5'-AMP-activated protein kinase, catalytic alpha subunit
MEARAMKVGQYILKQKIGEGAFAEVRLAVHETSGQEFAVKVFDRAALPRSDLEKDVRREIKIMQYLRHPGIVSIHAALVTETKMYLVMELVRGGELYDEIVSKRRVDEVTSRYYFQQLVDAMIYCHRRGVVHRDLKPENILVTADGSEFPFSAKRYVSSCFHLSLPGDNPELTLSPRFRCWFVFKFCRYQGL